MQVHRWYRATVEPAYGYIKRFRILGERYRGRLNCDTNTGCAHILNALAVITNICAYHNRCEPHRRHPDIPLSDSDETESESESEEDVKMADTTSTSPATVSSHNEEEKEQPARKRQRRQQQNSDRQEADSNSSRLDYGQYDYKWQEEIGTGYRAEQFKRQQPVWVWNLTAADWFAAVVTHKRPDGGINVRYVVNDHREGVSAGLLRPRAVRWR